MADEGILKAQDVSSLDNGYWSGLVYKVEHHAIERLHQNNAIEVFDQRVL